jgi:protein-L-isoaspartate(D-aspartate) O-methyltransferase
MTEPWIFHRAEGSQALGEHAPGNAADASPALTIVHEAYAENSRWECVLPDVAPGSLVELAGDASFSGFCMQQIGENRWMAGIRLILEALSRTGTPLDAAMGRVTQLIYKPFVSGEMPSDSYDAPRASVFLQVPPETASVRATAELSGEGSVRFSNLSLTSRPADVSELNERLVDRMVKDGVIRDSRIADAFRSVPRHIFLPQINPAATYQDEAIATHFAPGTQTAVSSSSQPTMMAIMLEQLKLEPGMRVLEIGSGTGYNAAVLSRITQGSVWTIDIDPEICREAEEHLAEAGIDGVRVIHGDGWAGYGDAAPYDRIVVTANAHDVTPDWFAQLKDGGIIALPWGNMNAAQRAIAFRKDGERLVMEDNVFCSFMPMRGAHAADPDAQRPNPNWNDWLCPSQPAEAPKSLIAYPTGTMPPLQPGQTLIEKRWFDYVAAWE